MDIPEVFYAKTSDGTSVAYQVVGDGPNDLLFVPGYCTNLVWNWMLPGYAHFLRRLASFSRLIAVDRRGSGLSDRLSPRDLPPLEVLADDLRTVLDEVGSPHASVFGIEDGAYSCCMSPPADPTGSRALSCTPWTPAGTRPHERGPRMYGMRSSSACHTNGVRPSSRGGIWNSFPPSTSPIPRCSTGTYGGSSSASPASAEAFLPIYKDTEVQEVLKAIRVPTLFLHRRGDRLDPVSFSE